MKSFVPLLPLLLLAGLGCSHEQSSEPYLNVSGATMGTTYSVRIVGPGLEEREWQQRIQQCLDDINARMSTYQPDSEVCCFNRSKTADWFPVSDDVARIVSVSLDISEQTGGAFDITVGPLVNLWSFGPDRRPVGIPSDAEIKAAQATIGYQHLEVRLDPPALRKTIPELAIDLSAIAKGYAVDQIGRQLEDAGVRAYMVEVGGEVRTRGRKADGSCWHIGIEEPVVGQRLLQNVLQLEDNCLATSGDYRNGFEWDGHWYSHEIDPQTGRPAEYGIASVSVLAPSTMLADAYATALMVMPEDAAWRLAEELGLGIMLVVRRSGKEPRRRVTSGFAAVILDDVPRGNP